MCLYVRLYVRFSVLENLYVRLNVRSSVLLNLYVPLYMLPNLYVRLYVLRLKSVPKLSRNALAAAPLLYPTPQIPYSLGISSGITLGSRTPLRLTRKRLHQG